MKTIYTFNQSLMNGTVTMRTITTCCATRELAEKTKLAVEEANIRPADDIGTFYSLCSDVEETVVYENEKEVPILN